MNYTIGISEMRVSNQPDDVLVTYSLGSCIGVTIYDPVARVGGMIHCMLPNSKIDIQKAQSFPCMFVDTGVPLLFNEAYRLGAQKNRIIVKVAGCSQILDDKGFFNIGERNYMTLRKLLWKNSVLITAEDIGGNDSRTLYLEIINGRVTVKSRDKRIEL
ncbi:TPA: chemotaxis protein CheD [Candidatus Poribacteria bacterium]|nr:chemotaxis protein CheD [Candidatus Poribacteria bacterium]